jgi:hypothetical protein
MKEEEFERFRKGIIDNIKKKYNVTNEDLKIVNKVLLDAKNKY